MEEKGGKKGKRRSYRERKKRKGKLRKDRKSRQRERKRQKRGRKSGGRKPKQERLKDDAKLSTNWLTRRITQARVRVLLKLDYKKQRYPAVSVLPALGCTKMILLMDTWFKSGYNVLTQIVESGCISVA